MPQRHSSQAGMPTPFLHAGRPARAGDGTRMTSRVLTAPCWPHLTACTPVTSLHYPDRLLFTNTMHEGGRKK